jgi:hypothetical protein
MEEELRRLQQQQLSTLGVEEESLHQQKLSTLGVEEESLQQQKFSTAESLGGEGRGGHRMRSAAAGAVEEEEEGTNSTLYFLHGEKE